jgi:hypothetical protein
LVGITLLFEQMTPPGEIYGKQTLHILKKGTLFILEDRKINVEHNPKVLLGRCVLTNFSINKTTQT